MSGYAGFYNGMERDMANHNQGWEQPVLEHPLYHGLGEYSILIGCSGVHYRVIPFSPTNLAMFTQYNPSPTPLTSGLRRVGGKCLR